MNADATLCARLMANASRRPEAAAIQTGDIRFTYDFLAQSARKFGTYLRRRGVRKGDRVALLLESSFEYAAALYGCWTIGAIAVPLNASASAREVTRTLDHADARVLVVEGTNRARDAIMTERPSIEAVVVERNAGASVDHPHGSWASSQQEEALAECDCGAADGAMILYTSGTTGSPKGVLLTHRNLLANTEAIVEYLELTAADSVLAVLPFHYSYGNSVLHTHIFAGATVVLGPSMLYPQSVVEALRSTGVTGLSGVAPMFSLFLEKTNWSENVPNLRYVTQAGGAMGRALTERFLAALRPNTRLFVMYGQTEASARLTWLPPQRLEEKLGSVGIPIPGVELVVVDDNLRPVAAGVEGEVLARGANVMAGYWNNPEQTERTLRDGWLRTGDVGYMDADGYLYLSGRRSDMIKTGAHRVSPEEIEEVVREIPNVKEVAAFGVDDPLLGQAIHIAIVGTASPENERKILRHCREQLALHKVPRKVYWRPSLPKTVSGKVKRFELAAEIAKELQ